jgi:two-component system, OmpR family, phosphate regulon response regulator PhoB
MKRILLVDDETDVRELLENTLMRKDVEILQAGTGKEAVALTRQFRPNMILMDIMMPGAIDGLEATHILKADSRTHDSKIIILTSKDCIQDVEEAMNRGADANLCKPFSPLELLQEIEEISR